MRRNRLKIAFDLIGADPVGAVRLCVIDPVGFEPGVPRIPVRGFVGMQPGGFIDHRVCVVDAIGFVLGDEGERPAMTLAKGDDNPTLAGLVFGQATVDPVLFQVRRAAARHLVRCHLRPGQCRVFETIS
jgi:hypothetical protein